MARPGGMFKNISGRMVVFVLIFPAGGMASGGPYSLTPTVGEAAVIGAATGGSYSASYGFLPGLPAEQQPVPARQGWAVR